MKLLFSKKQLIFYIQYFCRICQHFLLLFFILKYGRFEHKKTRAKAWVQTYKILLFSDTHHIKLYPTVNMIDQNKDYV